MVEYKEIKKKSGKIIVFCHLDELLLEYYKVKDIHDLEPYLKHSSGQSHYEILCPFCKEEGHTKDKLYIKDDFSVGFCFVCGRCWVNIDDSVNIEYRINDFLGSDSIFDLVSLPEEEGPWTLAQYFCEFDSYSERGINYLKKRNPFLEQLWEPLGFKFIDDNVIMPFYTPDNKLIYYQIRFIDAGKDQVRYYFPPISSKPPYILHGKDADPEKLIIVEGVYDAIAAYVQSEGKYVVIAAMGSKLSDYQLQFIRNYYMPKKILVWMDEFELSKGIRDRLKTVFDYSNIQIIHSTGDDPEEILMNRLRRGKEIGWIKSDYRDIKLEIRLPKFDF